MSKNYPHIVTPPPGPKARAIIEQDERYASISYVKEYPLVAERGEGAMIQDADGNRYLDFMAGIAVASTGHAHPRVVSAIKEAAEKFLHICATDFYYPAFSALCERLAGIGPGPDPKRVFLTNSGTEAVEGAIKLARSHTKRANIIAFEGAFHGRTMGAISLNASKAKYRRHFGPLLPGVHHLPYADPYRPTRWKEAAENLFRQRVAPDEIAAVFIEPILGEGGYIVPESGFLAYWREFCDANGALLIFDEIQSGIGRTGRMWASEVFNVVPDATLSAKGLGSGMPIGAIIAKESAMSWERGSHGSTFAGNPVCCAAALATLDVIQAGLSDNARTMGTLLFDGLKGLQAKHEAIGDVRGVGLMVGVEFVKDRTTKEPFDGITGAIETSAFKKGLLLLSCGRSTLRLAPPLVADAEDVAIALRIIDESLTELAETAVFSKP
jgi:4-aminobutyrate aminotransferase